MSNQLVFPCPSCGASLSVDSSASSVQCQFCGSSAAVPASLRRSSPSNAPYAAPAPASGLPEYPQILQVAPAAPYYTPMMTPAIPDTNRIFRGVMGFNIAITLAIFAFSACIVVCVFLAIGLAFVPALFGGLAPFFSR